jgi:hypothetical protein
MCATIARQVSRPLQSCDSLIQKDRGGEHPRLHLKDFNGALQADAYSGFHHLYGDSDIYEIACWARTRRKFHDIHVVHASPTTTESRTALKTIAI